MSIAPRCRPVPPLLLAAVLLGATLALAASARADPLRIALVTNDACSLDPTPALDRLRGLLSEEGDEAAVVDADDLSAEIGAYDVLVIGAGIYFCDWNPGLDESVGPWVRRGGGLVATGWVPWYLDDETLSLFHIQRSMHYPGLAALMPVDPGTTYRTEPAIWAISGHPITQGVGSFRADYVNVGGGLRQGATPLMRVDDDSAGAAWGVGDGRVVFLGANYLGPWSYYDNELLLDGSQPDAIRLLLQAVAWAGHRD